MKKTNIFLCLSLALILFLSGCSALGQPKYTNATSTNGITTVPLSSYILETEETQIWYGLNSWESQEVPEVNSVFVIKDGQVATYEATSETMGVSFTELATMDKEEQEKLFLKAHRESLQKKIEEFKIEQEERRVSAEETLAESDDPETITMEKEILSDAQTKLKMLDEFILEDSHSYTPTYAPIGFRLDTRNGMVKKENLLLTTSYSLSSYEDNAIEKKVDGGFLAGGLIASESVGELKLTGLREDPDSDNYIGGVYTIIDNEKIQLVVDSPDTKLDNFEIQSD